jgi:hypothetical protein
MPLIDGYGVLAGTLLSYTCDAGHTNGHYYHCTMLVTTRRGTYRCPVDLDSKEQKNGIEWRIVELGEASLHPVSTLSGGWHPLDSTAGSGALDYCLSPEFDPDAIWERGSGRAAFRGLEPLLRQSRRVYVFGEPFRIGRGVHNIHQNQGDPVSSRWAAENGPWQDGAIFVERHDGTLAAFLCRFRSQNHCPVPEPESSMP